MPQLNIPKGNIYPFNHRNKSYTQVVKKAGQKITAEELNYEGQIQQYIQEGLFVDILGKMFIGDAFKVVAPAQNPDNNNSIVIKAGRLYSRLGELVLPEDVTYEQVKTSINALPSQYKNYILKATYNDIDMDHPDNRIDTPTNIRTDVLVLVITKLLVSSDIDNEIVDPVLGEETAKRYKLFYSFKVVKNTTFTNSLNGFVYTDDFIERIPLCEIRRPPAVDLINNSMIMDKRETVGEVMTVPLYKKFLAYIQSLQGEGKGFNADKVDGKDVDDLKITSDVLWTAQKIKSYVDYRAKGVLPEAPVLDYLDVSDIPSNPVNGSRYIIREANGLPPRNLMKKDHIYTYTITGAFDGFTETVPLQGMMLMNKADSAFMIYSEEPLESPGRYGSNWIDFGGISDHSVLDNVLKVDYGNDDFIKKHITDLQYKSLVDNLNAVDSLLATLNTTYGNHTNNSVIDHPNKSVTFDKIVDHTVDDNAILGTGSATIGEILDRLATAIKILSGGADWQSGLSTKLNATGGTINGDLTITGTMESYMLKSNNFAPTHEIFNIKLVNTTGNENTKITFEKGWCFDDTIIDDPYGCIILTNLTNKIKGLNDQFAEGNNAGMLQGDPASKYLANESYLVYIIGKDNGDTDFLAVLRTDTVSLPSGYTRKRRIGVIMTDASKNIVQFNHYPKIKTYYWKTKFLKPYAIPTGGEWVNVNVPMGVSVTPICLISSGHPTDPGQYAIKIIGIENNNYILNNACGYHTNFNGELDGYNNSSSENWYTFLTLKCITNTNGQLYMQRSGSNYFNAGYYPVIQTYGFVDFDV